SLPLVVAARSTSTPCAARVCWPALSAASLVTTQSGTSRALLTSLLASGSRSVPSSTTRTGEDIPGRRLVKIGSSASTVPMPLSTASLLERIPYTRERAASPVISTGRPPALATFPSPHTPPLHL